MTPIAPSRLELRAANLSDRLTCRGAFYRLSDRDILIERRLQLVALRDAHVAGQEPQSVLDAIAEIDAQL